MVGEPFTVTVTVAHTWADRCGAQTRRGPAAKMKAMTGLRMNCLCYSNYYRVFGVDRLDGPDA